MVNKVFKITPHGLTTLEGPDAQDTINNIIGIDGDKDDSEYIFHFHGQEVYLLSEASPTQTIAFPEPQDYGTTSQELFAMAVTYASGLARLILKRLKTPLTFMGQLRQNAAVITPIIVIACLIFITVVVLKG